LIFAALSHIVVLMTGSLIFTIKAIKLLRQAAIHTPTFIGCNRVSTNACGFSESIFHSFMLRPKKKMMSNHLQAKLILNFF
jgi:hypothetical protein